MIHRIRFLRHASKWYQGDVAGFPLKDARSYVDRGYAVWVDPPPNGHEDAPDGPSDATAGGDDTTPPDAPSTHDMNVSEVRGLVADAGSIDGLRALRDSEVAHPQYEGGRKGALEAIDARIEELEGE